MKLTIKSLKQIPYDVEVENENSTVKDLKQAVEKAHGFDHTCLKLVFNGVVLDDSKRLVDCNIKEGNVVVMMNAKAKPQNVSQKEEKKTEEKVPVTTTNTSLGGNMANANTTTNVNRPKPQERDYTAEVTNLTEMGFPKPESEAAIKAARGNLNLAIEFLYNGIPDNSNFAGQEPENTGVDPNSTQGVLKNIASVVKILCYNNPSHLQNILLTLQQHSPQIVEVIKENEEEFKNLIQQPITDDDMKTFQDFNRQARGESGGLGGSSSSGGSSGVGGRGRDNVIRLSKQDYDAVGRLKELGFSEMDAVQAYFACDKNEDAAANILWENKLREQENELYIDYSQIGGGQSNQGQEALNQNQGSENSSNKDEGGSNNEGSDKKDKHDEGGDKGNV